MRFKTCYNGPHPIVGEVGSGISKTIPGQAQSVLELYSRFAKGLPVTGAREMVFDLEDGGKPGEEPLGFVTPDWLRMDLAEREDLARKVQADIDEKTDLLKKMEYDKKKKAQEELKRLRDQAKKQAKDLSRKQPTDQDSESEEPLPEG